MQVMQTISIPWKRGWIDMCVITFLKINFISDEIYYTLQHADLSAGKICTFEKNEIDMSDAEMKKKIHEKMEHLNDEKALHQVLELLNTVSSGEKQIDATKHMEKLFSENDNLL